MKPEKTTSKMVRVQTCLKIFFKLYAAEKSKKKTLDQKNCL